MKRLRFENAVDGKTIGTISLLGGGKATATGLGWGFLSGPAIEPNTFDELGPADGERWLQALHDGMRSTYVCAVLEEDPGE